MRPILPHAPIDEVVAGFVFDRSAGPDAVESGLYLAERRDRFQRHEIHELVVSHLGEMMLPFPAPTRTWLISPDELWLVQLQHDRFHANWRRRPDASYPGFTREGGVMSFVLEEFEHLREFCQRQKGVAPNPATVEVTKIDLLLQGQHWHSIEEAYEMIPGLALVTRVMAVPGSEVALQTQETVGEVQLNVSVAPARLKADPSRSVFRVEFRAIQAATGELINQLTQMNGVLNDAFSRLIPDADKRFS